MGGVLSVDTNTPNQFLNGGLVTVDSENISVSSAATAFTV